MTRSDLKRGMGGKGINYHYPICDLCDAPETAIEVPLLVKGENYSDNLHDGVAARMIDATIAKR